jgi:transmembrane sensor
MPHSAEETQLPDLMDEAIDWLVKLRGGNLNEAETHAFADWLSQDVRHTQAFAQAEDHFNDMVAFAKMPYPVETKVTVAEIKPSQQATVLSRKTSLPWLAIPLALAAAWLFTVGLVLPNQSNLLDNLLSDYHTKPGELRDIQLADGSHLLLNTNTAVSVDYQQDKRLITLHQGQARFTVAKDVKRPFEVKTDGLVIRALGTVFEVYRKAPDTISVTVQEHAVAAWIQDDNLKIKEVNPSQVEVQVGQQLVYQGGGVLPRPSHVNIAQATSWQQRRLYINDRPLSELIAELSRYRMGRIYLANSQLKNHRVTGVFPLDDPDEVLASVKKVLALQETRLGPWWVLLHH